MQYQPEDIPGDTRPLVAAFRRGIRRSLKENLLAAYLLGSIAFERRSPHVGDIDFFVVTHRGLVRRERFAVGMLHRELATEYRFGDDLDGLYITRGQASRRDRPVGWGFFPDGRRRKARDEMWAFHRAHLHRGACITLVGPNPRELMARVTWTEIERELERERMRLRAVRAMHPAYCALNLCRLAYTGETQDAVVSKRGAATWAKARFPTEWAFVIEAASRIYRGGSASKDVRLLSRSIDGFFEFASERIAAAKRQSALPGSRSRENVQWTL